MGVLVGHDEWQGDHQEPKDAGRVLACYYRPDWMDEVPASLLAGVPGSYRGMAMNKRAWTFQYKKDVVTSWRF